MNRYFASVVSYRLERGDRQDTFHVEMESFLVEAETPEEAQAITRETGRMRYPASEGWAEPLITCANVATGRVVRRAAP